MMNKSLRGRRPESSRKQFYGFQGDEGIGDAQKRAAVSGGFEVDNREASNRVDRSHSVSNEDDASHNRESLIHRKRTMFFTFRLPCRPLAEWPGRCPGCCAALLRRAADPGPITAKTSA